MEIVHYLCIQGWFLEEGAQTTPSLKEEAPTATHFLPTALPGKRDTDLSYR